MSTEQLDHEARLRAAIHSSTGDPEMDEFFLGSLYASLRSDRDRQVYREETAPRQAEVDLHLEGEGVTGHETSAARFAAFIRHLTEATKFTAKSMANATSYGENLLISGVMPGSVRVVLRAPDRAPMTRASTTESRPSEFDEPHEGTFVESYDSTALKRVVRVLTNASESDDLDDGTLTGLVSDLPKPAQKALKAAAESVVGARWEIDGTVRQRSRREEPVRVTKRGAERLTSTLAHLPKERRPEVRDGHFDGMRVSTGVAFFIPASGRPFSAAVSDESLLADVARLATEKDDQGLVTEVRATFDTTEEVAAPGVPARRSRVLRGFVVLGSPSTQGRLEF